MAYKLIIFDLDGTLIDSIEALAFSMNNVLEELKFPTHSIKEYKTFIGNGVYTLVAKALPEEQRYEEYISKCNELMLKKYASNWNKGLHVYDGISELLDELKKYGIDMAINTNKNQIITDLITKQVFNNWDFVSTVGLTDEERKKPNPAVALEIAEKVRVLPSETIFVGDSEVDVMTAKKAGMYSVSVLWGYRSKKELAEYKPDMFIDKPNELLKLLGN